MRTMRRLSALLSLFLAPFGLAFLLLEEGGDDAGAGDSAKDDGKKDEPGDDGLSDAGKRAVAEERRARIAAERAAKAAADELTALKASTATDAEKALTKAREEGKAEALKDANARLLKAEIKSAAAGKLADPNDAVRLLDPDDFTDKDGEVDDTKLKKAIADLLKAKPYLAGKPAGSGDGGGGPRGKGSEGGGMDAWIRGQAAGKR